MTSPADIPVYYSPSDNSNNYSTAIIIGGVIIVAIVFFIMYGRSSTTTNTITPAQENYLGNVIRANQRRNMILALGYGN